METKLAEVVESSISATVQLDFVTCYLCHVAQVVDATPDPQTIYSMAAYGSPVPLQPPGPQSKISLRTGRGRPQR